MPWYGIASRSSDAVILCGRPSLRCSVTARLWTVASGRAVAGYAPRAIRIWVRDGEGVPRAEALRKQNSPVDYMKFSMIGPPLVPPTSVVNASAVVTWIMPWRRNVSASMS